MNSLYFHSIAVVASLCGFFLARHIYKKKGSEQKLVCPIGFDCAAVVHSDYSKIFGFPVEVLGMLYYMFVFLGTILLFLNSRDFGDLAILLKFASTVAFIFSVYLFAVQAFILKQWCTWCLTSAFISTVIFFATMMG